MVLCWWVFWASFLTELYRPRFSAEIVTLDDYRPPTDRRAA
jgi:hypothetical protein